MRKLFLKRVLSVALATMISVGAAGCAQNDETGNSGTSEIPESVTSGQNDETGDGGTSEIPESVTSEYPESLSVFASISELAIKGGAQDRGDILGYQIAEEKTGCKIDWNSPADSARNQQFNLLIASGDLPDIIVTGWRDVAGGAAMYVEDEVIVPLSDYFEYMPNFKAYLDANPQIAKQFTETDGSIYYAPCLRNDDELSVFVGPTIRKDWLDKLGLEMPTNTDELYNVLKAFKTKDPNGNGEADEIPMSGRGTSTDEAWGIANLVWAFDTHWSFYLKDGKVTHGILEPEMKPALEYIVKLYSEGLIDQDYLVQDQETYDGKIKNDKSGFFFGIQPTRYYSALNDGTKLLAGVPYFDNRCYNTMYVKNMTGNEAAITTACEDPIGAAKWIDWFYSEEAIEAANFGIEGETFNVENGKRVLDEEYFSGNPDVDPTVVRAMSLIGSTTDFPSVQLWEFYSQSLTPWGKDAIQVWTDSSNTDRTLPYLAFTAEEQSKISDKLTTIQSYVSEQIDSIIIGRISVDKLDDIRAEVNKMGMEELLKIYNDAYERFIN